MTTQTSDNSSPQPAPILNSANILQLAQFIASHRELPFDMAEATAPTRCGTAGCIGGFAAALWPSQCADDDGYFDNDATARQLGLDTRQAQHLFYLGRFDDRCTFADTGEQAMFDDITRAGACQTLRRLADTGQVTWHVAEQTQYPDGN